MSLLLAVVHLWVCSRNGEKTPCDIIFCNFSTWKYQNVVCLQLGFHILAAFWLENVFWCLFLRSNFWGVENRLLPKISTSTLSKLKDHNLQWWLTHLCTDFNQILYVFTILNCGCNFWPQTKKKVYYQTQVSTSKITKNLQRFLFQKCFINWNDLTCNSLCFLHTVVWDNNGPEG